MSTLLTGYIGFKDNARQALEFYHKIFGGKIELHTFDEYHAAQSPDEGERIMHGMVETDQFTFMASDTPNRMDYDGGSRISMSLSGDDDAELTRYFEGLSEGGKITMPMEKQMWGDKFGMLVDKFGVKWMVNIAAKKD